MDTSTDSETTATLKFNILVKQCENLGKNCNSQHLRSIYKLIKAFFKNVLNSNSCSEFFDYIDLIEIFLKFPENVQLIIVKILSRKPVKYPGRVFSGSEVSLISQNTDDIEKFINTVPKDTISLHFLISNTFEQERNDYYKNITGRFIYRCSVEKLMNVLIEMITKEKLNGADVFNHFYGLLNGVYRVDFLVYKMFSSMALFFYSNEISRLTFLNHNIIDLYISRNENKLSKPNLKLLERSKLTLFTNVAMLYFGILNSNKIFSDGGDFSVRTLDEIMANYQLLAADGSFSEFDRMNFQNSTQFILFKCMKCMADNFVSILNSDIAKELLEAMIYTDYFIKLPVVLQCRLLLDYCLILKGVSSLKDVPRICRIFYHNLKGIPLYYAINFYKIYKEHKQFHDNRKRVFYDCDFLPVLEVTLEKPSNINVLRSKDLHNSLVNDLKEVIECSKGFTFDKNLWNEVCLLLIFNRLNNQEIHGFFYSEHFSFFSRDQIIMLLRYICKLLLNLGDKKNLETISKNYKFYSKYMKEEHHRDINFKTIDDYISFLKCFDIKQIIKLMTYILKNPFRELDQGFIYLWGSEQNRCYAIHLSNGNKSLTLRQRCAFYFLKKFLGISCYTVEYS